MSDSNKGNSKTRDKKGVCGGGGGGGQRRWAGYGVLQTVQK